MPTKTAPALPRSADTVPVRATENADGFAAGICTRTDTLVLLRNGRRCLIRDWLSQ